jgi:hypothetical protein
MRLVYTLNTHQRGISLARRRFPLINYTLCRLNNRLNRLDHRLKRLNRWLNDLRYSWQRFREAARIRNI